MYDDILGPPPEEINIKPKKKEKGLRMNLKKNSKDPKAKYRAPRHAPSISSNSSNPKAKKDLFHPEDAYCSECGEEWEDCECEYEELPELDLDDLEEIFELLLKKRNRFIIPEIGLITLYRHELIILQV